MALVDLHSAAASGDLARLRQRWWLNKLRINGYNRDKQTPLHLACINGHADVVQFLVEKKCKLNPCDKFNKSPLMKAVEHQHRDCAAILLEHGAKHNHRCVNGNTALHFAVMVSNNSLVELLLEHGADIDAKNKLGYTPLTLAITENREEMVKFLLQKGADVNVQDNVHRTPLIAATVSGNKKAVQLLLHHGAVFPKSDNGLYSSMVQNDVIANEQIGSSCYETTPVVPLETSSLTESCDVSKEESAEKDNGSAADKNKVSVWSTILQLNRGDYKAEGAEKKEGKHSLWNPQTDPKGQGKMWASEWLFAANSNRLDARSAVAEHSKGALPAASVEAEKQDGDCSSWGSEPNSEVLDEEADTGRLPAEVCRMFPGPSVAKECSKGARQAAGEAREEDNGSLCNPKTDSKDQGKGWSNAQLPAANSNRLDACSAAVEHSKGALPAASVEAEKQDGDCSSWGSEAFSDIVEELFAREQCRAADPKRVGAGSATAVHREAGGAGKDDDSPWDPETDSKGEWKLSAAVQPPATNSNRLDACSAAGEHGKGVLKQARRGVKRENRVLQPAGQEAKQEDDFLWDSETVSEGQRKVPVNVQLPVADTNRVDVSSAAVERGKAARAERKEHFISSSENKLPTLQGEDLQLKVDSSTQTVSERVEQPLARQKLDKILRKNFLEGAPLGTVKTNSRKEQKLLLEKLEGCKTRLKDLKELLDKNDYYVKSRKNALMEKKVIKILRNMQGRLAGSLDSSAAAILQLEENFQSLEMKMASLEDTIQQQAKTIEFFGTIQ